MSLPSSLSWLASSVDTAVTRASSSASGSPARRRVRRPPFRRRPARSRRSLATCIEPDRAARSVVVPSCRSSRWRSVLSSAFSRGAPPRSSRFLNSPISTGHRTCHPPSHTGMEHDGPELVAAMGDASRHLHQDPARRVGAPDPVVQRDPRSAGAAAAAAAPGHARAGRTRRPGATVPDGAHRAGGDGRPLRRHPRRRARRVPALAPVAAVPGPPPGGLARHAGQDLLQVRGREPGRLAQAEHGRPAGLLQPARRASASSRPRPAPGSGAARWRSPPPNTTWSARSGRWRRRTARSRTAAR